MKTSKILLFSALITAVTVTLSFARGPGGNAGSGGAGNSASCPGQCCTQCGSCDGTGPLSCDPTLCIGSGPCDGTGVPVADGSGKAIKGKGNPNATGTPLKDGSGKAKAPGKGPKNGTGNNANCPNASSKS